MIPISDGFSILILGITIGLIHSTDGDHILALSTLSRDYRKSLKNFWIGISWGLGHSTPLMILGIVILLAKQSILDHYLKISIYMEILVGIMLIFLGIQKSGFLGSVKSMSRETLPFSTLLSLYCSVLRLF